LGSYCLNIFRLINIKIAFTKNKGKNNLKEMTCPSIINVLEKFIKYAKGFNNTIDFATPSPRKDIV